MLTLYNDLENIAKERRETDHKGLRLWEDFCKRMFSQPKGTIYKYIYDLTSL